MSRRARDEPPGTRESSPASLVSAVQGVNQAVRERQRPAPDLLDALTDLQKAAADRRAPDGQPANPSDERFERVLKLLESRLKWRLGIEKSHDLLHLGAKAAGIAALLALVWDRLIA